MIENGLKYSKDGKTLLSCEKSLTGICVIKKDVRKIAPKAFYGANIKEVVLPDSLTEIGSMAFAYCKNLERVNFGTGIQKVGDYRNTKVFAHCKSLKEIEIPAQVKQIGCSAFLDSGLENVVLHEGLERICAQAFYCQSLQKVVLPDSVTEIGKESFAGIRELRTNTISSGLMLIEALMPKAFDFDCKYTEQVKIVYSGHKTAVFPFYIKPNKKYNVMLLIERQLKLAEHELEKTQSTEEDIENLLNCAYTLYSGVSTAAKIYEMTKSESAAAYLRENLSEFLLDIVYETGPDETLSEEDYIMFLFLGLLPQETLLEILDSIQGTGRQKIEHVIQKLLPRR